MRNAWCGAGWAAVLLVSVGVLAGCAGKSVQPRSEVDAQLFGPAAMRLHPIFTQVKDWTGDGKPDGIEAAIELQDQFGDPTKASGRIIFELFEYRPYEPERRGERVAEPWTGLLETLDQQRERWNRTGRTYDFRLELATIDPTRTYVLTAEFQLSGGGRFFDRVILEGRRHSPAGSAASAGAASAAPAATTFPSTATTRGPSDRAVDPGGPGPRTPEP